MKLFVIIAAFTLSAMAKPLDEQFVSVTQDTIGRYNVAVKTLDSSRTEQRDANGNVNGHYSFVDANGVLRNVHYTAGQHGFVATGDVLPVAPVDLSLPVQETPEVVQARAAHLALFRGVFK